MKQLLCVCISLCILSACKQPEGVEKEYLFSYFKGKDLIHWSEQKNIPVMQAFEGTRNTWAPELFYDRKDQTFYIFWASTVPGMFAEVSVSENEKGQNHGEKDGTYYLFVKNENSNPLDMFTSTGIPKAATAPSAPKT
jgi:hypothetical protein